MESSSYSHKESVRFDFPNAFHTVSLEIRRAWTEPPHRLASPPLGAPGPEPSPKPAAPRAAVLVALAAVYLIWGSTYLGIRLAIASLPPLLMAGSRFVLAGGLLYGFLRGRGAARPTRGAWGRAGVAGVLLLAVGNGGVTLGEQYLASGLAALLAATVPLWLALLGWLSGRMARPSRGAAAGLGVGLLGVYLIARVPGEGPVAQPGHQGLGLGLSLVAALVWAVGSLYTKQKPTVSSPFLAGSMHMLSGGSALLLAGLLRGEAIGFRWAAVTSTSWLAFAYLVVFGSLVAFTAYNWLLQAVEPTLAGTYAFVNPVVAVLLGGALAGEQLTRSMVGGAALIVVAVGLVVLGQRKPH